MKNLYKTILAGMTAFWAACSNESSVKESVAGATTEPSTSPTAELTEEQKAILARSFYALVDSSNVDPEKGIPDSNQAGYNDYFSTYSLVIKAEQRYSYPSKDSHRACDVFPFSMEAGENRPGVVRVQYYDSVKYFSGEQLFDIWLNTQDFTGFRWGGATLVMTKIVQVDSTPVVLKTVGSDVFYGYWGYGVSCTDYLNQFKQSCNESNGLFKDFGEGCRNMRLNLACASFIPEGISTEEFLDSSITEFKNECIEDSVKYAPFDDDSKNYKHCFDEDGYYHSEIEDCPPIENEFDKAKDSLDEVWRDSLTHTLYDYRGQFAWVYRDQSAWDDIPHKVDLINPKLTYNHDVVGYNELLENDAANAYREEGVYRLPDSVFTRLFPQTASRPYKEYHYKHNQNFNVYYLVVVKDVGAKGHILYDIDKNGIFISDIVKSGTSCPEDSSVHYSAFVVVGSDEWDVIGTPIVKTTYVSENWNCDKPESLEQIEPYGEWSYVYKSSY